MTRHLKFGCGQSLRSRLNHPPTKEEVREELDKAMDRLGNAIKHCDPFEVIEKRYFHLRAMLALYEARCE